MGATGVAHAAGYEAAWHNPALASTIRENKLTLGYGGAVFALGAPAARVSAQPMKEFVIGADIPIPFGGRLRDRVGIALGFSTPSDVIVRGRILYPERPQFPLLSDRAQSLMVRGGLGADVGWGVRVGIGFAALAELVGTVVAATDATGKVGTRVEDQLVATYAPTFGLTWDGPAKLRFGATYRGTLDARLSVVIDGTKLSSLAIPLLNIAGVAQYDPSQAAIEVARIDALNVLALQVVYKQWSNFPGIIEPTVAGLVPPKIDWRDTVAVRIGAEQGFELAPNLLMRVRGGAWVETSPLPSDVPGSDAFDMATKGTVVVPTRYYDTTRTALTLGVGVSKKPFELDLFAQYHVLMPRTITSEGGTAEASGHITVFGLTGGVKF
jgi:long-chain fatty acid transport protein